MTWIYKLLNQTMSIGDGVAAIVVCFIIIVSIYAYNIWRDLTR